MTSDLILFLVLAVVAVASALSMLLSKNAVYSALFLVINFATIAVFFLLLGSPFLAMAQVTVYAGAIMVLFLFVIMLLGAEQLRQDESLPWQRPVAIFLGDSPPMVITVMTPVPWCTNATRVPSWLITAMRPGPSWRRRRAITSLPSMSWRQIEP